MQLRQLLVSGVLTSAVSLVALVAHAGSLSAQYFETPNVGPDGDFGTCCSSPPATLEVITLGSALGPDGLPVTTTTGPGAVVDQNGAGEILWWSTASTNPVVTSTGSGPFTLGVLTNMYAPNSTGSDDSAFFETAILSGTLYGTGADATITIGSDDDALVYLDGLYVGGEPGVHGNENTVINLGDLTGKNSLEIFYADRSSVDADLFVSVAGAAVPEPAAWALILAGFAGLGAALRRRRSLAAA